MEEGPGHCLRGTPEGELKPSVHPAVSPAEAGWAEHGGQEAEVGRQRSLPPLPISHRLSVLVTAPWESEEPKSPLQ